MKLFDGKKLAGKILAELKKEIKEKKLKPGLAVILVGENENSKLYIKLKKEAAKKNGIDFVEYNFSANAFEGDIIAQIKKLNQDELISGIIAQLPLPAVFNTDKIIEAILPAKDVDGFHKENRLLLEKGEPRLLPVLPSVILAVMSEALKNDFNGKKILALVNSEIFGKSLKLVLKRGGAENVEYKVRNTCVALGIEKELRAADVLISVCGCPNLIKGEMIKKGAILIDGGVTRYHDGKVVGDFDRQSVESGAAFLTPVPGGLGPLTVAMLLRNVVLAACIA